MLAGLFAERATSTETRSAPWAEWFPSTGKTWSGQPVDDKTAMQLLAVYGSVRMISDGISTLPTDTYVKQGDMSVETAGPKWLANPTTNLSFNDWCSQILSSLLLHGNGYVAVSRRSNGQILEVVPLDPSRVGTSRDRGRLVFTINGQPATMEIRHVKGLMLPGSDVGLAPVEYARQTIGLGLATVEYGSRFFDGEGNMPGVIELPHPAQPDTLRNLAEQWRRRRSSGGKGLPGVLDQGATWKATGVTNEQAQFLSTRNHSAAEIAGQMFLIDPADLGIPVEGSSLTYANLEQRMTRRVQVTFLPWLTRVEHLVSSMLPGGMFFKFNVEGLLRGDMKSRYEAYAIGIDKGFVLPDEARSKEDMPPMVAPVSAVTIGQ